MSTDEFLSLWASSGNRDGGDAISGGELVFWLEFLIPS
jgi:hypothetical protein